MSSKAKKSNKKGFGTQMAEIRRCNDLRCRIKSYLKEQSLTQSAFATQLGCSNMSMSNGTSLTGSDVYSKAMKYLKTRYPLSKCSDEDRNNIRNDKWVFVSGHD
jgi:hypothetical protein